MSKEEVLAYIRNLSDTSELEEIATAINDRLDVIDEALEEDDLDDFEEDEEDDEYDFDEDLYDEDDL